MNEAKVVLNQLYGEQLAKVEIESIEKNINESQKFFISYFCFYSIWLTMLFMMVAYKLLQQRPRR